MKPLLLLVSISLFIGIYHLPHSNVPIIPNSAEAVNLEATRLSSKAALLKNYAASKGFSTQYGFLADMRLPSGRKRFFIYDLQADSVIVSGLVAHGSCGAFYMEEAQFSNNPGIGCSSSGKYRIGYAYQGRFGKAYKLFGLDSSNSAAFQRNVVLHSYSGVPDKEVFPEPICNSLGCPMVSPPFLERASTYISRSEKPVLLWIFK
ncbi:MAG: hypothetical protein JWP88_1145 [Flaviaesturariibacter sp.]|nr:hypothetical protein [Flaviaesturariibacter sp.]